VFLNLVINSIEAMAGIATAHRVLTISGELSSGPAALITVHDNGVGFRPEVENRIFEAFYTTKPQGMGMGLRISRSIVEAHGGRLWAKSAESKGTTFSCLLPAGPAKEP
jgi:signal transduction histidine kinase